ncbi:MAG: hypothetical protein DWB99_04870 [Candidatus Poseidoniales archaeon]|nr:MAG: hypothetical protein DWB99_04870 [Candidatus Poseidoniales archaeon]|tara:strand:- start:586 stop:1752 length:1167 start_codon:yes stop_codon:yes gene_type:complete
MKKLMILLVILVLVIPSISAEGENYTAHVRIDIPSAEPASKILHECFVEMDTSDNNCNQDKDVISLSWWSWSDQTNSNWPDDDSKSRASTYGLELNETFESISYFNQHLFESDATNNSSKITDSMPVIDLEGELIIAEGETDIWYIRMPVEMTPLVNLTDDTLLYIFLSQKNAVDHHGRVVSNLIYDMKPEVGFGIDADNTTKVEWIISSEHLEAAGVELNQDPYGWQLTMAFFGAIESDNTTEQLLSLHHFDIPAKSQNVDSSSFYIPALIGVLLIIICYALISQSFRTEKGMPKISSAWKNDTTMIVEIQSFSQRVEIKSINVDAPWKMKNNPKSRFIEPEQTVNLEIRFKQNEPVGCQVGIRLEVEELGAWTQYLMMDSSSTKEE